MKEIQKHNNKAALVLGQCNRLLILMRYKDTHELTRLRDLNFRKALVYEKLMENKATPALPFVVLSLFVCNLLSFSLSLSLYTVVCWLLRFLSLS